MTVICWDGKTLAGDKRCTVAGQILTATKIFRVNGELVGLSGDAAHCAEALNWIRAGCEPSKYPAELRDRDKLVNALLIKRNGEVWRFEDSPHPYQVFGKFHAIGGGSDFALAAMYLGKCAAEAVEVASALNSGCGNGVDTLTFGEA